MGHRGQRAVDGLREHGRRLRDRRRVHAQPVGRREKILRRVPAERAGRRRRRRHPHAATDQRSREVDARGVQPARRRLQETRSALPRHAGHRVHDPVAEAVPAADAHRQTHRIRGGEDRVRHGRRRIDHAQRGGRARRSEPDRAAPRAGVRRGRKSEGAERRTPARPRTSGRTGRGDGTDRIQRRERRAHGQRRGGDSRAHRDIAGRHRRHAQRRRHSHVARRSHVARGRRRARHGTSVCRRRGIAEGRLQQRRVAQRRT